MEADKKLLELAHAGICAVTTVAGPLGASFANVIYDKMVLKRDMTDEDMFKSFAIGAAAGYAAEAAQGFAEGKRIIDSTKFAGYLSKSASSIARNVTTDIGNVALNGESYTSKDFFVSLATGASSVEIGNGGISNVIESTIEGGLDSIAMQSVENDLNFQKIDFKTVEQSIYDGFATGITRESVHTLLDATLIKAMPEEMKRMDLKAFDAVKEAFYLALVKIEEHEENQRRVEVVKALFELDEAERDKFLRTLKEENESIKDEIALDVYGRRYRELKGEEILHPNFKNVYREKMLTLGKNFQENCPIFAQLVERYNNGRSLAGAAEVLVPGTSSSTFKVVEGGLGAATRALGAQTVLKVLGTIGSLIYSSDIGQGSDGLKVGNARILPPSPYDKEGWELYNRAFKGDRAALLEYLNRDGGKEYDNFRKTDAEEFEKKLKDLSPGERVAQVRTRAKEVAEERDWTKNKKLSKKNNRDVYTDKDGNHWSVDTQHGRFEKLNRRGKHQGEYDMDLNPKDPPDLSGKHDINI